MNQLKRNYLYQKLNLCPREEEKYIYSEKSKKNEYDWKVGMRTLKGSYETKH